MPATQTDTCKERRPSPAGGMNLNLSSNNPFRRAASPSSPSLTSPTLSPPVNSTANRMSTNPFLDNYQPPPRTTLQTQPHQSPPKQPLDPLKSRREVAVNARNATDLLVCPPGTPLPNFQTIVEHLADLLLMQNGLVLNDRAAQGPVPDRRRPSLKYVSASILTSRSGSTKPRAPQQQRGPVLPTTDRPTTGPRQRRSQDETRRPRKGTADSKLPLIDVSASGTEKKENRRPRRNSDTSVMELKEDERKHPEKREHRSRGRPKRPNRQVDLIDKLDVTGIYGPGSETQALTP